MKPALQTRKDTTVSIGLGIFLFVVGAILVWGLDVDGGVVNIDTIGFILMGAGLVTVIIGIALLARRRQTISTTRSAVDPASGERVTQRSTDSDPLV
jgi:membrane-bound ClpP family serine protease